MFTGIVELLAPVIAVEPLDATKSGGGGFSITLGECATILDDCHIGDSIAVNGTCLTVTEFDPKTHGGYFKVGVAPETLKKTNLGKLKVGSKVNCERAMAAHTRFGGHFVQGHVDTTAIIRSVVPNGNALTLTLRLSYLPDDLPLPSSLSPYLIPKGYVTLDGASLTLIDVSPPSGGALQDHPGETTQEAGGVRYPEKETVEFSVMLIKHTQEVIGLSKKMPGHSVNVELDMVGKYVHRAVAIASLADNGANGSNANPGLQSTVDGYKARLEAASAA
ncbi:Riboflavin synthase alpha chain [Tilletia horrida]|uniref:Riboflavin synthase alpha chain n=1 Tax=Tilletia horrida TaxID=155126 RepID=A0AAN6GVF6_9BASI|nr:Riboflavin synthase alpha chain [Tilletia horrida]KAK0557924.1 Riboflavin synthase alpha chain [Tilletia horrida]KAK0566452.1 Riboflavin synthase alpha chain [Tilletia horrida]